MHVLLHLILDPRNDFKVGGTQKMTLIKILPYHSCRSVGVRWSLFGSVKTEGLFNNFPNFVVWAKLVN